jgi:hypothetical protein
MTLDHRHPLRLGARVASFLPSNHDRERPPALERGDDLPWHRSPTCLCRSRIAGPQQADSLLVGFFSRPRLGRSEIDCREARGFGQHRPGLSILAWRCGVLLSKPLHPCWYAGGATWSFWTWVAITWPSCNMSVIRNTRPLPISFGNATLSLPCLLSTLCRVPATPADWIFLPLYIVSCTRFFCYGGESCSISLVSARRARACWEIVSYLCDCSRVGMCFDNWPYCFNQHC